MSSSRSSTKHRFPDAPVATAVQTARSWFDAWIRRRGPIHPPLTLGYRQIYILPTRFGWMAGLLLLAMLMGSLNFNNNLGLFTTFLVSGIGLLSMHVAHRNLDGVRIAAVSPEQAFAGDPAYLTITLHDTRGRARRGLAAETRDSDVPGVTDLAAFASAELRIPVATRRRGWQPLPRIRLRTRHPIGWFEAWSWVWPEHKLLIWPSPAEQAPPLATAGRCDNRNRAGDESDEFHGLRDWREGDPLHRIAWKASQRHQHLLARQFTRPERERIVLRLADAPGRTLEERISIVTRWVLEAERHELEYGLDLGRASLPAGRGESHRARCLDALAEY